MDEPVHPDRVPRPQEVAMTLVQEPSAVGTAVDTDPALAAGKSRAGGARSPQQSALDAAQLAAFHTDGYLALRNVFGDADLERFERAVVNHPPLDQHVAGQTYPGPGRWTLARNALADPDLAYLAARPELVEPVRAVLDDDPKLLMWAWYDRTPGGQGLPSHNDYKRWRPIGSSMRWTFAIVPFVDFDDVAGPLLVAPGSHRVAHTQDPWAPVWNAERPRRPAEDAFVDPQLRRGDLLLMDMHCWHRAGANNAAHHRTGMFTKWCAASQPPATGWFPHDESVRLGLGPEAEHLLGYWSAAPITATAALLERTRGERRQYLLIERDGRLSLPVGPAQKEGSIPDWDEGNLLAGLVDSLAVELKARLPWLSYVGDYGDRTDAHGTGLTRTYGYRVPEHAWGIQTAASVWLDAEAVRDRAASLTQPWVLDAIAEWERDDVIRGKGVTESTGRADQYAV
ncbi:MAG: phytanoyl-CoA dioxygenase family protein [Acidimicrobiia bacterium]